MKIRVLATCAALGLPAIAAADEIRMLRGKDLLDVTVTEETFEKVSYRRAGTKVTTSVDLADVKEVVYGKQSDQYGLAVDARDAGNYKEAVLLFQAAANDAPKTMAWIEQYALYAAAECLRLMRDFDGAIKAYDKLIEKVPATRFHGDALVAKALCYEANRDPAKAKAALDELVAAATQKGLGERWKLLAEYHQLRMGGAKTTLQQFDDLQQRAEKAGAAEVANLSRISVGNSFITQGNLDDARIYFSEIIDDRQASPTHVVAGAYIGLGNTYVRKDSPSKDDFHQALWAFARVVFQYGDQLQQNDMLAEALYWTGRCLQERQEDPDLNDRRARVMYTRVINEFPGSQWAEKAGER